MHVYQTKNVKFHKDIISALNDSINLRTSGLQEASILHHLKFDLVVAYNFYGPLIS